MTKPILPKLKTTHNVKNFNEAGKWDVRTQDSLQKLSSGLKVDKVETEICSIPDMWARPMLFEMALTNPEHVLHPRILGEWRGLLAMLGLKDVLALTGLTASRITLPLLPQSRNGEDDYAAQLDQRDFLVTVTKLLPKASLAADTTWRSLYVFLYNGDPFAMTSPTTLVATAADYLNRISNQEVGWFDGVYLNDPTRILPPQQREILSGWLSNLIASLDRHATIDLDRWNLLSGLLRSFRKDLGPGESFLAQAGFGIQGSDAGVFRYLDKAAEGTVDAVSHVQLIPSPDRSPEKPLLVFDRGIADQWNMTPQNVTVAGAQTLASPHIQAPRAEVWKREDFFTKKLFVIFQENAFPGSIGGGNQSLKLPGGTTSVTPIQPINEGLLRYLNAETLADRIRWDQTPEGLRIRLFLQVTGPDPHPQTGRTVELSKTYRREDIQTMDNVPTLEVWPNFKAEGWKAYYTCFSTDDATSTFSARPFAPDNFVESEITLTGRRQRRYWRTQTYPEAMICKTSVPNAQTNQHELHNAGLLLLAPPQVFTTRGESFRVGIDFGASSTTISVRQQGFPEAVKFADRKVSITASGDRAQAQLFDFFLPRRETEMPVLSFFHDFQNSAANQQIRSFLDGHAYLLETAEQFDPSRVGLTFDLKWSTETNDRRRVRAFVTQLCLQTAAELVAAGGASVSWAFSYPTAFSKEQREGFPGIWNLVTTECTAQSGLHQNTGITSQTESVAAALYFVNQQNAATAMGTIFIDIGGSTSDISVWQDNKPVWQTSVLLAGRNIFSDYLWHNPDILSLFGVNVAQLHGRKNASPEDRKSYYALTDVLLRYNSEQIFVQLPIHAGSQQIKALRQHLALGVSGLFYYVGSLLHHLIDQGTYKSEVPNIYLCGNGSKIFRWLDIDDDKQINTLYKMVFSRAAGWTDDLPPFRLILSEKLKKEAAFGLVWDNPFETQDLPRKILAGESFTADGLIDDWSFIAREKKDAGPYNLEWNSVLTAEAFTKRLYPPQKLHRLNHFLTAVNEFARNEGLISAVSFSNEQEEEVRKRLGQHLSRYHKANETTNIVVEPVFIVALRNFLEVRLGG